MWLFKASREKDYIWNPATCSCQNGKYLISIFEDLVIMCHEIEETIPTRFNEKNITCKTQNFYIFLAFYY